MDGARQQLQAALRHRIDELALAMGIIAIEGAIRIYNWW